MFRKNSKERNTSASTRVASSKKLPSDFFLPVKRASSREGNVASQGGSRSAKVLDVKKVSDSMLFTFNQNDTIKKGMP